MTASTEQIDDHAVIGRVLGGRINDFEILLNKYRGYVFTIVSRRLPASEVAEMAQDIFVEAYRSLPKLKGQQDFKKWLARIAIYRCYDYWRSHYQRSEVRLDDLSEEHRKWLETAAAAESDTSFTRFQSQNEAKEILQRAMRVLSLKDRTVLTLIYLDGYAVDEAAELLGWTSINVRVRAYRSRNKMQKIISEMLAGISDNER